DREIVLAAVLQDGHALNHASEELMNDREIVLAAIEHSVLPLSCLGEEIQKDREIMMIALRKDLGQFLYIKNGLEKDRSFIKQCLKEIECFPFDIRKWRQNVWQPGDKTLRDLQIAVLEGMMDKGQLGQFERYSTLCKKGW